MSKAKKETTTTPKRAAASLTANLRERVLGDFATLKLPISEAV